MDFEQEVKQIAKRYADQGYETYLRPGPDELPPFARDFQVEILARRSGGGVLAQVKRDREALAADTNTPRYADITGKQPGWRFDFHIVEGENPMGDGREAVEPSDESLRRSLKSAEELLQTEYIHAAFLLAWAGLEAAMRRRLRAAGEKAGWGTTPRAMLNELYSAGVFSAQELPELEGLVRLRNQLAHGFVAQPSDRGTVQFLIETARRLLTESQVARMTA